MVEKLETSNGTYLSISEHRAFCEIDVIIITIIIILYVWDHVL